MAQTHDAAAPTATDPDFVHFADAHCTVVDDECTACHVVHGDPCPACGGRGFHGMDCAEIG